MQSWIVFSPVILKIIDLDDPSIPERAIVPFDTDLHIRAEINQLRSNQLKFDLVHIKVFEEEQHSKIKWLLTLCWL